MEDQLLKHFDDTGRKEIKETREKYLQEKEELDKSYKGRMAIKKELIRIKETGPQKCLDIMMKLTMKVDDIKNKLDECDFEEKDDIMNSIDELENLIANPDNDNNIFNSVTELMSVCDESEITKKINISNSERKMKKNIRSTNDFIL